jgi:hypothetical protein
VGSARTLAAGFTRPMVSLLIETPHLRAALDGCQAAV